MRLRSLAIYVALLLACFCGIAFASFTVTGTGDTQSLAVDDAVRQIGEIFGTLELSGSTSVKDYTVTQDQIKAENHFKGMSLTASTREQNLRMDTITQGFTLMMGFFERSKVKRET